MKRRPKFLNRPQDLQLAVAEPVQTVMAQGQLAVATFDARTGALKQGSALVAHLVNDSPLLLIKVSEGAISGQQARLTCRSSPRP